MYWYTYRWYDPVLAHFNQPETIVPDPNNAQDWDRFSYVNNSPINYSDPSGHMRSDEDSSNENTSGNLTPYQKELLNNKYYYQQSRKENLECGNGKCPGWTPYVETIIYTAVGLTATGLVGSVLPAAPPVMIDTISTTTTLACADSDCGNEIQYADEILQFAKDSLQHALDRHGSQWGFPNRTTGTIEIFKQMMIDLVNAPSTQQILGSYRGMDAIHFFDPKTGLDVMTTLDGAFIATFRLSAEQAFHLFMNGKVN